jgi:hypothetical protein
MTLTIRIMRGAAAASLAATAACGSTGGAAGTIGDILGSVLQPTASAVQVAATVRAVDTQGRQISLQQSNGSTVAVGYDDKTKVIYNNQSYAVTSLEFGDQVNARVYDRGNNTYYTDSLFVTQPVSGSGGTTSGTTASNVQTLQGSVRQLDRNAGWFTMDTGNGVLITVSMPYRPASADVTRFNNLRSGEWVRIEGVFLNNGRVEPRRFY